MAKKSRAKAKSRGKRKVRAPRKAKKATVAEAAPVASGPASVETFEEAAWSEIRRLYPANGSDYTDVVVTPSMVCCNHIHYGRITAAKVSGHGIRVTCAKPS